MIDLLKITVAALMLAISISFAAPASGKVDVDLTKMSGTVVYAMVYQMVTEPMKFKGKRIKMAGVFSSYYDDETDQRFYGCVISDALACCSQGLAFELAKPRKFPDEYPDEGSKITIKGVFDYRVEEDGVGFPVIRDAEMFR